MATPKDSPGLLHPPLPPALKNRQQIGSISGGSSWAPSCRDAKSGFCSPSSQPAAEKLFRVSGLCEDHEKEDGCWVPWCRWAGWVPGLASATGFGGDCCRVTSLLSVVPQFPHESHSNNLLGHIYYFLKALSFPGGEC